jgi:DNA-binding response OmpR family regulator
VVEDPFICHYLQCLLALRGYQVLEAAPQRGVELVRSETMKVTLVITNTPEIFAAFAERVPVLYLAAIPDLYLAARFRACRVLRKPFDPEQFLEAVDELAGSL